MEAPVRHEMVHCLGFGFWGRAPAIRKPSKSKEREK